MIYEWTLMLAERVKDGMHMDAVAMGDCEQTDAAASRCQRRGVEIMDAEEVAADVQGSE